MTTVRARLFAIDVSGTGPGTFSRLRIGALEVEVEGPAGDVGELLGGLAQAASGRGLDSNQGIRPEAALSPPKLPRRRRGKRSVP
jgi:hypothetical protein